MSDVLTPVRAARNETPTVYFDTFVKSAYGSRNRAVIFAIFSLALIGAEYYCVELWFACFDSYISHDDGLLLWLLLLTGAGIVVPVLFCQCWLRICNHWLDWKDWVSLARR